MNKAPGKAEAEAEAETDKKVELDAHRHCMRMHLFTLYSVLAVRGNLRIHDIQSRSAC